MAANAVGRSSRAPSIPSSPPLDPFYRANSPTSSEPPLFSSDGPLESEELSNYESPRVKRKYPGPWWNSELGGVWAAKKTKLSRNFDSGIYMMSDGSFGSDDAHDLPHIPASHEKQASQMEGPEPEAEVITPQEHALLNQLKYLIEDNATQYDLTEMQLEDENLRHLRLIKPIIDPPKGTGITAPAEGQYRSMIPELKLFLDKNCLSKLHPTLFDLEHLTHLSLMQNKIEELPPQIAKLRNLKSLTLSWNNLEWLPCEILDILNLAPEPTRVTTFGNPLHGLSDSHSEFMMTATSQADIEENVRRAYNMLSHGHDPNRAVWYIRLWEARLEKYKSPSHHRHCPGEPVDAWNGPNDYRLRFIGATPPSYFDRRGNNLLPKSAKGPKPELIIHTRRGAWPVPRTFPPRPSCNNKVQSLLNLAMRNALKRWSPAMIRDEFDILGYIVPPDVEKLLGRAEEQFQPQVLPKCHVCAREYLVPAAEWFEIWHPGSRDSIKVRVCVCSWACVPDEIALPPQQDLVWERERP